MGVDKLVEQEVENKLSQKDYNTLKEYSKKYLSFLVVIGFVSIALQVFKLPSSLFSLCYNVAFSAIAVLAVFTIKRFNKLTYYVNLTLLYSVLASVFVLCIRFGNIFFSASDGVMGIMGDKAFASSLLIIVAGVLVMVVAMGSCVFAIYYLTVFISNRKVFTKK